MCNPFWYQASRHSVLWPFKSRLSVETPTFLFAMLLVLFVLINPSHADEYKLKQLATLGTDSSKPELVQAMSNPLDENQLILANVNGEISLFDIKRQRSEPIINPADKKNSSLISIALHPNFTLKKEHGYAILYTSHLEPKRIRGRALNQEEESTGDNSQFTERDAVIYEWQFSVSTNLMPFSAQKREVFRVGVESTSEGIRHMRFNPHVKPWQDDYGLMYVSVNRAFLTQKLDKSSNAILRFRPEKFGLKSYTAVNNGIAQNDDSHAAMLIGNLGRIVYFSWNKQNENHLQIALDIPPSTILVDVPYGELTPALTQVKPLFQLNSSSVSQAFLTYHEKAITQLRHHLLYLIKRNGAWELTALNASQQTGSVFLWQLPTDTLSANGHYSLISDRAGQLMLIDYENLHLFGITSHIANDTQAIESVTPATTSSNSAQWLWLVFLPVIGGVVFYWRHRQTKSARKLLRQKFARFAFEPEIEDIHLFKRHGVEVDTTLTITHISQCEVLLNSQQALRISNDKREGFDNEKENALNKLFVEEKRRKMIDDEVRKVEVTFKVQDTSYECCIYLRKGNQRYTKAKFAEICEYLIDWCWHYSAQINPNATGKRKNKPKIPPTIVPPAQPIASTKEISKKPIQADNRMSEPASSTDPKSVDEPTSLTDSSPNSPKDVLPSDAEQVQSAKVNTLLDSQIIESLDKLSQLKQAGHLTEDEFNQAKTKLLRDLTGR